VGLERKHYVSSLGSTSASLGLRPVQHEPHSAAPPARLRSGPGLHPPQVCPLGPQTAWARDPRHKPGTGAPPKRRTRGPPKGARRGLGTHATNHGTDRPKKRQTWGGRRSSKRWLERADGSGWGGVGAERPRSPPPECAPGVNRERAASLPPTRPRHASEQRTKRAHSPSSCFIRLKNALAKRCDYWPHVPDSR